MKGQVVIVGGGAMGSAIAYFLAADPAFQGEVVVVERDPTYSKASSALSASSIRQQFSTPLNIELSRFGCAFIKSAADTMAVDGDRPALSLHEKGYLVMASAGGLDVLKQIYDIQRNQNVAVALLTPDEIAARFPYINTDGIAGASLGLKEEGWFDAYGLMQAFRRKARALGVRYVADEAVGFERQGNRITAVNLKGGERLPCDLVVNAAGPWAAKVAEGMGIDLPVRARKRDVFVFTCKDTLPDCPLVVDPSGLWFRPEGDRFIVGTSPKEGEPDPDDLPLEVDHAAFEETVWPILAERVPAFEAIRPAGSWAGYYEMNIVDHNGIVGYHPDLANAIFANGFSGHGIQHSPGIGRGVAELIVHGRYTSLDLSPLGYDRILEGRPMVEINVI